MKKMNPIRFTLAAAAVIAALASVANAQLWYVAGSGLTPAWTPGAPDNQMTGGPAVFSLTAAITAGPGSYHDFKVTGTNWDLGYPGNNVHTKADANGSNTFYFYPGTITDGWNPIQNRVGYADPGGLAFEVAGDFNGWGGGSGYQLNALGNGLYSNSIVVATAGNHEFKFRTPGTWGEIRFGSDFGNDGANGAFTTTTSPQTVPVQLDLPHGRWVIGELAPPPVTNQVVFAVDMSSQILLGNFDPATHKVFVSGAFNGWPGTGGSALALTNDPPYNGNNNIYYATNVLIGTPGSLGSYYKFTCNAPAFSGSSGYEPRSQDRSFNLLTSNAVLRLPVVSFGDVYTSDFLPVDTYVTFRINMTNAVTSTNSRANLNTPEGMNTPHTFDPVVDTVAVNGNFLTGGWMAWDWYFLSANEMTANPPGSQVYEFGYIVPKGSPVRLQYKYAINYASNPSTNYAMDNEAAGGQDHVRYIRSTATGSYVLPLDTFGDQHLEPSFGQLTVAPAGTGAVKLNWLGRPGVHVQSKGSLTGGSWVDHIETDGATWTNGGASPEGLLSSSNWPTAGESWFFRLIKP